MTIGRPTRSASSILSESTPKNPTDQVKEKLGLIECSGSISKKDDFTFQPVRSASSEKSSDESEKQYRPTLSPFFKGSNTPMLKENKKKPFETPQGFINIFESLTKQENTQKKRGKESLNDIVASLDFVNTPVKTTEKSTVEDFPTIDIKPDQSINEANKRLCEPDKKLPEKVEKIFMRTDEAINKSNNLLSALGKNDFKTPVNKIPKRDVETSYLEQRTCPRKFSSAAPTRKPLTEVKLLNSKKEIPFTSRKQRLDFEMKPPLSSSKLGSKDITKENMFNAGLKKRIPLNMLATPVSQHAPKPIVSSGLTELVESINLLKEERPIEVSFDKLINGDLSQRSEQSNSLTANSGTTGTIVQNKHNPSVQNQEKSPKENVDNLLQNAIEMFGMSGFNMDQKLEPVPTDSKIFKVNGKCYNRLNKIAKGGSCKVRLVFSFFFVTKLNFYLFTALKLLLLLFI